MSKFVLFIYNREVAYSIPMESEELCEAAIKLMVYEDVHTDANLNCIYFRTEND